MKLSDAIWRDFYNSFHFLLKHAIFNNRFMEGLDLFVVKVNPETLYIENDKSKNTKVQIWLKTGPYLYDEPRVCKWRHGLDLDCNKSPVLIFLIACLCLLFELSMIL